MCSRIAVLFLMAMAALAQQMPLDLRSSVKIVFPSDSPLAVISADLGESRATARGGAVVLDLHMALSLRNLSQRRIRGVILLVQAQEVTPGGKGSVAVPSLDVSPGQAFPLRVDLRLLRPLQTPGSPPVQIGLDGVLFQDLSFFGPNRLNSRRSLLVWELEAQRDRRHFLSVLNSDGPQGLQRAMLDSLDRQAARPRLDVQVVRGGRSVSAAASAERQAQFSFLKIPDSPVEPLAGAVTLTGQEARAPHIQVLNRSSRPVRYFEVGWIVEDRQGKQYWAATVPASDPAMVLAPGGKVSAQQDSSLRFPQAFGAPISIKGMLGFVTQVEYADGTVWIPNRASLADAKLLGVMAPSPEEQRLSEMYRRKGLNALVEELNKFHAR